jgi:hypothetical protein
MNKLQNTTSQISFMIIVNQDLANGLFVTASHYVIYVMYVSTGIYYKKVTKPLEEDQIEMY